MKCFYIDANFRRMLRIIFPETSPKTIQNGRTLMVYDRNGNAVGCFFSIDECAKFFKMDCKYLKKIMSTKKLIYGLYKPMWIKTGVKKGWHTNKGEII